MADFLSLISAVPSLMSLFGGGTSSPYQKQQEQLAAQQRQYSEAAADPTNPIYQNTYNRYRQQNNQNLAQTIAEAQAQNRLSSRMGRTPLFSPERGGETMFRSLMSGQQQVGAMADQQTRSALQQAAGGNAQALNSYNSITPYTVNSNRSQLLGYQGIGDLLQNFLRPSQSVGSMGGGLYPTLNNAASSGINWY